MSNQTSIARPYAKALFRHAHANNTLPGWSSCLQFLGQMIDTPELHAVMSNSTVSALTQADIIFAVMQKSNVELPATLEHFIQLLAVNKRLSILPEIVVQYEVLRAAAERTLVVTVDTFAPLTATQVQQLTQRLSERLGRLVTIEQCVDKSLIGGAVIRANNLVIDGSVKGQLMKLGAELAA